MAVGQADAQVGARALEAQRAVALLVELALGAREERRLPPEGQPDGAEDQQVDRQRSRPLPVDLRVAQERRDRGAGDLQGAVRGGRGGRRHGRRPGGR